MAHIVWARGTMAPHPTKSTLNWSMAPRPVWQERAAALDAAFGVGLNSTLGLFVVMRLLFSLFAAIEGALVPVYRPCNAASPAPNLHDTGLSFLLFGVWQRADACAYEWIATIGYPARGEQGDGLIAFFPLYPLLMRLVGLPLAGNLTLSGLIISGAAFIAAMVGLYRLVRDDFDDVVAQRTLLYIAASPAAFFLFAPYTEALFLALAVWSLYLARGGKWGSAAGPALLVGLVRGQGAILAVPLAWEAMRQWRAGDGDRRARRLSVLVPLLPMGSFLLFLFYSKFVVGWSTIQAQRLWRLPVETPWQVVVASWRYIHLRGSFVEAVNFGLFLLFALLVVAGARSLPLSYTLFAAPQLALLLLGQPYLSPLMSECV